MKRKNPWIAAILNFLFSGIGFIYLETTTFIIIGVALFLFELLKAVITWSTILDPLTLVLSLVSSFIWAALGYVCAEYVNKCMPPPPPPTPSERPTAPAPPSPKIHCVYCGAENSTVAIFCQKCGKKIVKPT